MNEQFEWTRAALLLLYYIYTELFTIVGYLNDYHLARGTDNPLLGDRIPLFIANIVK